MKLLLVGARFVSTSRVNMPSKSIKPRPAGAWTLDSMKQPFLPALAALLVSLTLSLVSVHVHAQSPSPSPPSTEAEEAQWKAAEERMLHVFEVAVQLMSSPDTDAIRKALEKSQPDWFRYRESHCALQAWVYAYRRTYDERNVQRCRAHEADLRTQYIQSFVP